MRISLSIAENPPHNTMGTIAEPIGKALDIKTTQQISDAKVRLPIDLRIFDGRQDRMVDQQDAFIAVYNADLGAWIPLMTELDRKNRQLVAVAPHFSLYQTFRTKASDVTRATGHDVAVGFNLAKDAIVKTVDDWFNGESTKPKCSEALRDWQVSANAKEIRGCAVGPEPLVIRVGNDLRIPYDVPLPAGSDIEITDDDLGVEPTVMLLRALNRPAGTMTVGARGSVQFGLPEGSTEPGTHLDLTMYPDQLGLALDVILAMLNWLPETKVFREEFSPVAVREVWELGARNLSVTQFFVEFKAVLARTVTEPAALRIGTLAADASSCAVAAFVQGANTRKPDAKEWVESTIAVAKDCLSTALEMAGSRMAELWSIIKTIPESFRAFGQMYDAVRSGFLHSGGQLSLSIRHEQPDPLRTTPWLEVVASDVDCSTPGLGVELRWPPKKHDITGDGVLDSFVPVECVTGDASSDTQLEVFDGASDPARPTRIGVLTKKFDVDNPSATTYPFGIEYIRINDLSFDGRTVTMLGNGYTLDDCFHCPSYAITQRASWTGSGFSLEAMQANHV